MSQLSPFHEALFGLMRKNALDFAGEVPSSIEAAIQEKSTLGMESALRDYHHIFKGNESRVEAKWLASLSPREFADAGMSAYLPKVYRGLPRYYHRDHPAQSAIKENFVNLPALRRLGVEKAIASLYRDFPVETMQIILFSWVIFGGLGDWVAACETARLLQQALPSADVQVIAVAESDLPMAKDVAVTLVRYELNPPSDLLSEELLHKMRNADLILQIPTYYPKTKELFQKVLSYPSPKPVPRIRMIGEYGFLESGWFHPKSGNVSLGLHALEMGVFVKKQRKEGLDQLEDRSLLKALVGLEEPSSEEVGDYLNSKRFHLAYLITPTGGIVYLNSVLKMWEKEDRDIDFCVPNLGWFIDWIKNHRSILLGGLKIKKIVVVDKESTYARNFEKHGKIVRLIHPGAISASDMQRLMHASEPWVAVRGDQSFSEAITSEKPFFYDCMHHARYFIKDLAALAENRMAKSRSARKIFRAMAQTFLWNLPEDPEEWVEDTHFQFQEKKDWRELAAIIGINLQDPEAIPSCTELCRLIAAEHSCNQYLVDTAIREATLQKHPDLARLERNLLDSYGLGKISLSSLVKNIRARMMQIKT